jgi:hypothetical protein
MRRNAPSVALGRLLAVLAIALSGCRQQAPVVASPKPPPAVARPTLAVFPAAPYTYELSIEQGKDPARDQPGDPVPWRFQVRLVRDGQVLGQVSPFAMACGDAEPASIDRVFGADLEARAWGTSLEHCETDLAVRPVELSPGITALLATERTGYEAIYPLHWLIGPRNGRLAVLWESPAGPDYFTRVRVLPTDDPHRNGVAFIEVFTPSGAETKSIKAVRLSFEPLTGEIKTSALPDARSPLFLVTVGPFRTAKAAEQAWTDDRDCLFSYRVFKAALLPALRARDYLVGLVLARREDAAAAMNELARCSRTSKASLSEYPAPH